ncbi:MAG: hypothetical protein FWG87_14110 [Defluviitaleaceae bacterium]|nr:hypothetical protein [Defluviitaleaceae bacterium]
MAASGRINPSPTITTTTNTRTTNARTAKACDFMDSMVIYCRGRINPSPTINRNNKPQQLTATKKLSYLSQTRQLSF